ncbi:MULTISPECIES: PTS sugar transporter subunit IIC [Clostridium]|jgi:cellobiose PTS system EIIC component|uniref:Lichenan permease IIC component n=1 Tax=bioreactor metagenome TaxID=1076179 RepID=A0A644WEC7_9ZZZZ|nr:PTS sugar transporter subunit IIC [Clostridium sp. C8]KLE17260.1 PTS lactose transporter subunit IIC [Clostridium sp. C8]
MNNFAEFLDKKLSTPMAKLAEQRHLRAVRDGIIATLPLIIVGSFFLIIANPPLPEAWGITKTLKANAATIVLPFRMTMYIMTIYACWGIGYSLARSYKLDGVTGGTLSAAAFFLTLVPKSAAALAPELMEIVKGNPDLLKWYQGVPQGFQMPMANMGGGGMFVGIIVSILAVEIFRFTNKSGFKISMPEQVPPSVARSFEALTPAAIIVLLIGSITYYAKFDWHGFVGKLVAPLVSASDTLPSVWILVLLVTFFWSFGIHGVSIVGSIARPLWLVLLEQNSTAAAAGQTLPAIAAEPFFQWFIWIGGSGCTIGLVICLAIFAKSSYAKQLGRVALVPGIFNINEPIIFGAPVVLNPTLIIPFIITPLVTGTLAWIATSVGLVSRVIVTAPWTLPGPIGAFIATNDWRAAVLNVVCIIISVVIYYPFVKMYDKKLLQEEQGEAIAE